MPNCVVCNRKIKSNDSRGYILTTNRKYYGCWDCNESHAFDEWIDQNYKESK